MEEKQHKFSDNWAFKTISLFEVPIFLHISFFGLILFLSIHLGIIVTILFILSLLAHEFAHILVGKRLDIPTKSVVLTIIGAAASMEIKSNEPKKELKIAIAGPAMSILLSIIFFCLSFILSKNELQTSTLYETFLIMSEINAVLGIFNLAPIFPMDGGRIFRSILRFKFSSLVTAKYTLYITGALCLVAEFCAFYFGAYIATIIFPLLFIMAHQEYYKERKESLKRDYANLLANITTTLHRSDLSLEVRTGLELMHRDCENVLKELNDEQKIEEPKYNFGKLITTLVFVCGSWAWILSLIFSGVWLFIGVPLSIILSFITIYFMKPIFINPLFKEQKEEKDNE